MTRQEDLPIQDPALLVRNIDQEEMEYLLEKLISMTIHQSCVAAQHEASAKDTEVKMEQVRQSVIRRVAGRGVSSWKGRFIWHREERISSGKFNWFCCVGDEIR